MPLDSVYLNCTGPETAFGHTVRVDSDADSHRGETLVTLHVDGAAVHLFPREARDLAASLLTAGNLAQRVAL
jgi:hypothetical protein